MPFVLILVGVVLVFTAVQFGLHAYRRHRPPSRQIDRARKWRQDAGPG
ncbi:MAG TPA: hypothetical protein VN636_08390 [Acidimicrobiia bacterium]|nr:hypothetical protein [Acidimicrobiia bacterium]